MKTLGVIGGLSWHSTAIYYQHLNQFTANSLGGLHSANLNMVSLNFAPIAQLMKKQAWGELSDILLAPAKQLQESGVNGLILANNTLHQLIPELERSLTIPCLHIADALGDKLTALGISTVGLLGTASTMQSGFYKKYLVQKYQIDVVTPSIKEGEWLDNIIFTELCYGVIKNKNQQYGLQLIENLKQKGAEAIALACTELPLLFNQGMAHNIPLLDTSILHCQFAVNWSLENQ